MNFLVRLLMWFCDAGSHTFFYISAFLLLPVGFMALSTGSWKLVKLFVVLFILTALLYFVCLTLYALGLDIH